MKRGIVFFTLLISLLFWGFAGAATGKGKDGRNFNGTVSIGKAPVHAHHSQWSQTPTPYLFRGTNGPAYGYDALGGNFLKFFLNAPNVITIQGSPTGDFFAGDFGPGGLFYAVDYTTNSLVTIDTANATVTPIGTMTPQSGESWTGISYDASSNTMYAVSTDITKSTLYTVDVTTGTVTPIGSTTDAPGIIDIAVDNYGNIYAHDIVNDAIYTLDPSTGSATLVGNTGFNANYAQGMDFNPETGELYLAAYNNTAGQAELRLVDLSTGNTTFIGTIGDGSGEVCAFGIAGAAGDPDDPKPPTNFMAYSDYTTPTQMLLNWTDPTTYINGNPLTNFSIVIARDGSIIDTVAMGVQTYTDTGLNDGTVYTYSIWAVDSLDSASMAVEASWTAGGAHKPNPPTNFTIANLGSRGYRAYWTNPSTNVDGTPMDDFAAINLYEDGTLLTTFTRSSTDTGAVDSADFTPSSGTHAYYITAVDNETPPYESDPSNVAYTPVSYPLTEDFEYGLGSFSNAPSNAIDWTTTTDFQVSGSACAWNAYDNNNENILELNGALDLTGATNPKLAFYQICKTEGGYDFGYVEYSTDGGTTWTAFPASTYMGQGDYSDERFDEDSYPIWGTSSVTPSNDWWQLEVFDLSSFVGEPNFKIRFRLSSDGSITRYGWLIDLVTVGVPGANPIMVVQPTQLSDTLLVNATSTLSFTVSNNQSLMSTLTFTITEDPQVDWLTVSPDSGELGANSSATIQVNLDATGLSTGLYQTNLIVSGNDTTNATDTVMVSMWVNASPEIAVNPDSIYFSLMTNQTDSATFFIKNVGAGPLNILGIEDEEVSSRNWKPLYQQEVHHTPMYNKGAFEPTYGEQTKGSGGPDPFGYKWIDSDEPNGPVYQFTDISTTGTPVTLQPTGGFDPYDEGQAQITLPFNVKFYGQSYNQIQVNTNGFITFDMNFWANAFSNAAIPDPSDPNGIVAVFWDDLDGRSGGEIYTQQIGNKFIIQWDNWGHYPQGTEAMKFQVVLFQESSTILLVYEHIDDQGSSTYGIESMDGTMGLQIAYNQNYAHDQLLVKISKGADWLSENPTSGTLAPGDSMAVTLVADAAQLFGGTYLANVVISSNDPVNPTYKYPKVRLDVTGIPDISTSPDSILFDTTFVGQTPSLPLFVNNIGTDTLRIDSIVINNPVFSADTSSLVLPPLSGDTVYIFFNPLTPGDYSGDILVYSNDADTPVDSTYVHAVAVEGPVILVDPVVINEMLNEGDSLDVPISISNIGASNLEWSASLQNSKANGTVEINLPATQGGVASKDAKQSPQGNAHSAHSGYHHTMSAGLQSPFRNPVDVLLITPDPDPTLIVNALNAFGDINVTVFPQSNLGSITVNDLLPYPVVYVYNDYKWESPGGSSTLIGDVLADYIDAGGKVIDNLYTHSFDDWGMGGRYITQQYAPFTTATQDFWVPSTMGTVYMPDHPIMAGVTTAGQTFGYQDPGLAPGADRIADWDSGQIFIAANQNVVAFNLMPLDPQNNALTWTGDVPLLYHNAILWLAGGGSSASFIKLLEPTSGVVAPGNTATLTARLYGVTQTARDDTFNINIRIDSNDPSTPTVLVDVTLTVITGINGTQIIPTTYDVSQNYPNPFNPTTTIKYQLPEASKVKLVIYNVLGQKVRTLVNKRMQPGYYQVVWDGRNDQGVQVSSGIYIYRFESDGLTRTMKMILMK